MDAKKMKNNYTYSRYVYINIIYIYIYISDLAIPINIILDPLDPWFALRQIDRKSQEEQTGQQQELRRVRVLKQTLQRAKPYTNRWRLAAQQRAVRAVQAQVRHLVERNGVLRELRRVRALKRLRGGQRTGTLGSKCRTRSATLWHSWKVAEAGDCGWGPESEWGIIFSQKATCIFHVTRHIQLAKCNPGLPKKFDCTPWYRSKGNGHSTSLNCDIPNSHPLASAHGTFPHGSPSSGLSTRTALIHCLRRFDHFHLEMCPAPQHRAFFQYLKFQKCSEPAVLFTFSLLILTSRCSSHIRQGPAVTKLRK